MAAEGDFLELIKILNHSSYVGYDNDVIPTVPGGVSNHPTQNTLTFTISDIGTNVLGQAMVDHHGWLVSSRDGLVHETPLNLSSVALTQFNSVYYLNLVYSSSTLPSAISEGATYAGVTWSPIMGGIQSAPVLGLMASPRNSNPTDRIIIKRLTEQLAKKQKYNDGCCYKCQIVPCDMER